MTSEASALDPERGSASSVQWAKRPTWLQDLTSPADGSPMTGRRQQQTTELELHQQMEPGAPGSSAQREYERRHAKREQQLAQRWGRFAGVAKALSEEPQSTRAWKVGADGERALGTTLDDELRGVAHMLHDRHAPRLRSNIDHLIIGPSGVWVVDAKKYRGRIERRDVGGFFRTDVRVYVGGRDKTKLAEGVERQVALVTSAIEDPQVPVHGAICFVEGEWGLLERPFKIDDVWVLYRRKLVKLVTEPQVLDQAMRDSIADLLDHRLPPA